MLDLLKKNKAIILYVLVLNFILLIPAAMAPIFKQVFTDYILGSGVMEWLPPLLILMAMMALLSFALTYMQRSCINRLANKIEISGISKYIWILINSPMSLFSKKDSFRLLSQAENSRRVSKLLTREILSLFFSVISVIFYFIMMLQLDLLMSSIVIVLVLLTVAGLKLKDFLIEKFSAEEDGPDFRDLLVQDERDGAAGLENIETYKSTASEGFLYDRMLGTKMAMVNASKEKDYEDAYEPFEELPQVIFLNLLLLISAFRIMDRSFSIGTYLAFQAYAIAFFVPLSEALDAPELFRKFNKRVKKLYKELSTGDKVPSHDEMPTPGTGHIEMKNVCFAYGDGEPVLHDISLSLAPGQRLAVVGNSGAGKTTLLKLLRGIYEPDSGEIRVCDVNPARMDKAAMAGVMGCANQDVTVFAASVRDNITLWDDSLTDEEVYDAAGAACIHSHIASLEGAYEFQLSEHGRNLSGGQKQRLEIARAFLYKPAILLLDEATGAIDPINRTQIEESILARGCACVAVTHTLAELPGYDEIIVLENGRITHRGSHDELLQNSDYYAALFREEGRVEKS